MNWFFWRPVFASNFALDINTVKDQWSIDDLMDAHELLDMRQEAEERRSQQMGLR